MKSSTAVQSLNTDVAKYEEKGLTQEKLLELYEVCRNGIRSCRRNIFKEWVDIGRYCCYIEHYDLWKLESYHSFEQWIADSEYTPGLGRTSTYMAMAIWKLGDRLLNKYNINILDFEDIGKAKMSYLYKFLVIEIKKNRILELLHMGKTLSVSDLKIELEKIEMPLKRFWVTCPFCKKKFDVAKKRRERKYIQLKKKMQIKEE